MKDRNRFSGELYWVQGGTYKGIKTWEASSFVINLILTRGGRLCSLSNITFNTFKLLLLYFFDKLYENVRLHYI